MSSLHSSPIIELFSEPTVVLSARAEVLDINRSAKRLFGGLARGSIFTDLVPDADQLKILLERFSSSSEVQLGSLSLIVDGVKTAFGIRGARLAGYGREVVVGLRICGSPIREFSILSAQVKALNAEIHQHRHAKVQLQDALSVNQTLYQELQHRVKNHLQMCLSMFATARRRAKSEGELATIDMLNRRIGAVVDVHAIMYDSTSMEGVSAAILTKAIAKRIQIIAAEKITIECIATNATLTNDVAPPLALILNELLANAVKYGGRDGHSVVTVFLRNEAQEFELVVQDQGPGIKDIASSEGTGFNLIRGLCRQIGGTFNIANDSGARISVRFYQPTKTTY
jgi:two-component sensor histidine kinase